MRCPNPVVIGMLIAMLIMGTCALGIKMGILPQGEYTTRK